MLRLYLHIGMPKTGSTDIQAYCNRHRETLTARGVLFPATPSDSHSHRDLLPGIGNDDQAIEDDAWLAVRSGIKAAAPERLILSEEDLFFIDSKAIEALRQRLNDNIGPHRTHLIVYLRRQDLWLESRYKHAVKAKTVQFQGTIDEFIRTAPEAQSVLDYSAVLDRWRQHLEPTTIAARPFESRQFDRASPAGDLVADFLHQVGVSSPTEPEPHPAGQMNEALERHALEVVRGVNRLAPCAEDRRTVLRAARQISSERRRDGSAWPHSLLSPARRREILERAEPGNSDVARRYLGQTDGQLFTAPLPADDGTWQPYPGLTPESVIDVFAGLPEQERWLGGADGRTTVADRLMSLALGGGGARPGTAVAHRAEGPGSPVPPARTTLTPRRGRAILRRFRRAMRALLGRKT